ncbi:MAG TPA: cytochrome C oxidase subunit IV family protein [Actinomycetota bacterium]|nr:cytochrome C oxidase subunit IV family protein [Actinomycetota bacterium]
MTMTGDQHTPDTPAAAPAHVEYHPSAREYVRVGLILVALTLIEVWLSYSDLAGTKLIAALLTATLIKFLMVVGYFMHLKFDSGRFSRMFALGAIGAFTLYVCVLLMFGVWGS